MAYRCERCGVDVPGEATRTPAWCAACAASALPVVTCPQCATAFARPQHAREGSLVQCARCRHAWTLPRRGAPPAEAGASRPTEARPPATLFIPGPPAPWSPELDPLSLEEVTRQVREQHAARSGALSTPHVPTNEASLRAAALAAPHDDAPRRVLADLLLERGDPLGSFIALQLDEARAPGDLMRKVKLNVLLRDHGASWLPPGVDAATATFHRGFLQAVTWRGETAAAHPAWRFVERLTVKLDGPVTQTPFDVALPLLREVSGAPLELVRRLTRLGMPGLEALDGWFDKADFVGRLGAQLSAFPRLKRLGVQLEARENDLGLNDANVARILDACRGLEHLRCPMPRADLPTMQRFLREQAPKLTLELVVTEVRTPPLVVVLSHASVNLLVNGSAAQRGLAERWTQHLRGLGLGPVKHVMTRVEA